MKYPRTFHFSCSQEIFSDDKMLQFSIEQRFYNTEVIVTEKMDGGNCCLHEGLVYSRTHGTETFHKSFSKTKAMYKSIYYTYGSNFDFKRFMLFGENVYAIHSIEYNLLDSPFYLFAVFDTVTKEWLSWSDLVKVSIELAIPLVPLIGKMEFRDSKDLNEFVSKVLKGKSKYGPTIEGVVLRNPGSIKEAEFSENVAKYVRKGHVQSGEHWDKNWKPQKFLK